MACMCLLEVKRILLHFQCLTSGGVAIDSSGGPTRGQLYAGGEIVENVSVGYYYFHDGRSNISHLTNSSNVLIERYTYDLNGTVSYFDGNGNPIASSSPAISNRFLFAGAILLPEANVYDMRNRMYFPHWGRFLQADPIGFKGDAVNLYRYCGNDPVDRTDPTGLLDTSAASEIWRRQTLFDSGSTSQGSLYGMNKFQEIQGIINRLTTEIADAKKIEEKSGSKVSWEFSGNWGEPYGNHVTGEKLMANGAPAAGRTDRALDINDRDGGVGTKLNIDWKVRRSVASDPEVGLREVRDHVAGLVKWGIAMQKHTNSGKAGQSASSVRNFLDSTKTIGGVPQSRFHNEISTQRLIYDRSGRHAYSFDPNAD